MKKNSHLILKRLAVFLLAIILAVPLLAVGGFSLTAKPVSVAAEETETVTSGTLSDDNFLLSQGMATTTGLTQLMVGITLKNPALETWLLDDIGNTATALFTVYRDNGAGVLAPKFRVYINAATVAFTYDGELLTQPVFLTYLQKIQYDDFIDFTSNDFFAMEGRNADESERIFFDGTPVLQGLLGDTLDTNYGKFTCIDVFTDLGNERLGGLFPYAYVNNAPTFRFCFDVESYTTSYCVGFEYGFGGEGSYRNTLTSDSRSISGVLTKMQAAGMLEKEFEGEEENLALAQAILLESAKQEAKIEYLEEIEGTYLAKKVSATVSVPIVNNRLAADDVATALGKESMICQTANLRRFVYDEDRKVWAAEYLSAVHLKTRTVDAAGHVMNMFLDINKSYAEYYGDIGSTVTNGAELYGFMFNQLKNEYFPKLEGLHEDEVYGYFGQVWLPNNNPLASFNATAAALFNINTEELGFIKSFEYIQDITYEQHEKLMDDYNYTWLKGAWERLTDFVTGEKTKAKYYFFTAKPMEYVGISQTGDASEDADDGALENVVRDPLNAIGDALGDFFGLGEGAGNALKRITSLLVVVAVAVGVVYVVAKVKGGKKKK